MRLNGKSAIVTGGGSGLGATFARRLAREGASVVVADLNAGWADEVSESIRQDGGKAVSFAGDLAEPARAESCVEAAVSEFRRVDILINNAGGEIPGGESSISEVDLEHWDRVLDINLRTALLCTRYAAPHMKRQRYGRIVNLSSRTVRGAGYFASTTPEYVTSKMGIIGLTRHAARELGPSGITVNCIVPGFIVSGPRAMEARDRLQPDEQNQMIEQIPLRRLPDPEEISDVMLFLSSDESSYVTGASIDVNGGAFMG